MIYISASALHAAELQAKAQYGATVKYSHSMKVPGTGVSTYVFKLPTS